MMLSVNVKDNLIKFFFSMRFSFWKPSLIFYLLAVISFVFWVIIGPSSWRHVDDEWRSVIGKECTMSNQLSSSNLAFIYGHREPLELNNENQRKSLEVFSDGCIKRSDKLQIVDSYEFQRDMHLEMDKYVGNGGSSSYGYLISKLD